MRSTALALACLLMGLAFAGPVVAYPLDGRDYTHIDRLTAYYLAREQLVARGTLSKGSMKMMKDVRLNLTGRPNFQIPERDGDFERTIRDLLGQDARYYGIAVLDITDSSAPRYAEVNATISQNPASVGKIGVALAMYQALADVYPSDIQARERLLRDTIITANKWSQKDHHTVPIWKPGDDLVQMRPIEIGDQANLWTYLDWMLSASSNGAASQIMSELMLLEKFGTAYPVPTAQAEAYLADTPQSTLSKTYLDAMLEPLGRNGIDKSHLRQGGFFTRSGKQRIPGTNSIATPRELVRYLTLMEQGKLVDPWSSLEIKRLLYLTDTRIRYASAPALDDAAVYFKSGSLYSCKQEKGFTCGKYMGNKYNFMNSIAIVEADEGGKKLKYIVALLSNVLRKNSLEVHIEFATEIHRLIGEFHRQPAQPPETSPSPAP